MHELHEAYILHTRSFSDSKVLIEFLSRSHGRLKAVARAPNKKNRAQYQVFQPLMINMRGSSELKTLTHCEVVPNRLKCLDLKGYSLFCAMYINELVQRLTPLEEPDLTLFREYEGALLSLSSVDDARGREALLRHFEFELLSTLGYQVDLFRTVAGERVEATRRYRFAAGSGFSEVPAADQQESLVGETILAVARKEFTSPEVLQAAKVVTRAALKPLLGDRPIKSRELFR